MSITGLLSIFLAAILTNNYILSKFLGICPFLGVSKKLDTAVQHECCRYSFDNGCATAVTMANPDITVGSTWPWLLTDNRIHPDHCSTCSVH